MSNETPIIHTPINIADIEVGMTIRAVPVRQERTFAVDYTTPKWVGAAGGGTFSASEYSFEQVEQVETGKPEVGDVIAVYLLSDGSNLNGEVYRVTEYGTAEPEGNTALPNVCLQGCCPDCWVRTWKPTIQKTVVADGPKVVLG